MSNPETYGRRKLPYPYSYLTRDFQVPPELNTGRDPLPDYNQSGFNFFVIALTPDDQLKFTSALQAGFDLIYPDDQLDAQSQWLYAREYPNDFTGGGIVSICDAVLACINSGVLDEALRDSDQRNGYGAGSGTPDSTGGNPTDTGRTMIDTSANDGIFAAVTGLVDFLNQLITDIFEKVELATTGLERTAIIVEGVPIVGILPFDDIIEFADNELENLAQGYAGAYTAQLRDEYRCDLFCIAVEGNGLDFQAFADYFAGRAATDFTNLTFEEAFNYFLTGSSQGEAISHAAHYLVCLALAYGSQFVGISAEYLTRMTLALQNDSDPDWAIVCDPCGDNWSVTFLSGNGRIQGPGITEIISIGSYNAVDDRYEGADAGAVATVAIVDIRFALPTQIEEISFDYDLLQDNSGGLTQYIRRENNQTPNLADVVVGAGSGQTSGTVTYNPSPAVTMDGFTLRAASEDRPVATAYITSVTVRGVGYNPFS